MAELDPVTARFDVLRKRLQSEKAKAGSEQEEALKRRYAQQGLLQSGAYLKGQEEAAQKLEETTQKGLEDIGFAEEGERQRIKEVQEARQFQTSEREASQKFSSGEREATQQFASGERKETQLFNKQLFDEDLNFKKAVQAQNFGLAEKEFEESKKANFANFAIALKTAGFSQNDIDTLFSSAGEIYKGIGSGGTYTEPAATSSAKKDTAEKIEYMLRVAGNEPATRIAQELSRTRGAQFANDAINKSLEKVGGDYRSPKLKSWLEAYLHSR